MKNNLSSRASAPLKSIIYRLKLKATVHTYGGTKFLFLGLGLLGRFLFLVISVFGFPLLLRLVILAVCTPMPSSLCLPSS